MYTEGDSLRRVRKLRLNLLDAIRVFEKNKVVRAGLGDEFVDSYAKNSSSTIGKVIRDLSRSGNVITRLIVNWLTNPAWETEV